MSEPLAVYLVRGDDASLRAEAVRALVHELVGDGDATLMVEEFEPVEDGDASAVADAAQTPPFLTERRIVVARDVSAYSSDALEPIITYLGDPLPSTSLLLVAGDKGRLSQKLVTAVKKAGHIVEAGAPSNKRGRDAWLSDQMRGAPVRLDGEATAMLDKHLGEDLGRLRNMLEALAAAYGHGTKITADDLSPFLGEAGGVPPWDLTDAIDSGKTDVALATLQRMLGAGDRHPLALMATLHAHYTRMLRLDGAGVRDAADAAALLGMKGSSFPAEKALRQSRKLGHDGVAEAIRLLTDADLDLRNFKKDWPEQLVLEVLVARLSRVSSRR